AEDAFRQPAGPALRVRQSYPSSRQVLSRFADIRQRERQGEATFLRVDVRNKGTRPSAGLLRRTDTPIRPDLRRIAVDASERTFINQCAALFTQVSLRRRSPDCDHTWPVCDDARLQPGPTGTEDSAIHAQGLRV